ncbi:hypothetical protein [Bradyrhizobium sp. 18BD]
MLGSQRINGHTVAPCILIMIMRNTSYGHGFYGRAFHYLEPCHAGGDAGARTTDQPPLLAFIEVVLCALRGAGLIKLAVFVERCAPLLTTCAIGILAALLVH